jgi:alcohol dehydrogenase class IV
MESFNYFQPTSIYFGTGRIQEIAEIVLKHGKRCLLVTTPPGPTTGPMFERVKKLLTDADVEVIHFQGVNKNPTTETVSAGAALARKQRAEVVLGLGGGSSMDTAKAIAVEATHPGTSWDYLFFRPAQPTPSTLPIIAVSTTSGTGSQVTQVAVVTNSRERTKSALYHDLLFPRACIVDPELMLTVPEHVTASTGFDAFCHAFESTLHPKRSGYVQMLAIEAIQLVAKTLPGLLGHLDDLESRTAMAWADTLAGLCIANAGVTLPHGVGMAISGMYPHVLHGESLAIIYPAFTRFTWKYAVPQFATVGRIFNSDLVNLSEEKAAEASCEAIDAFIQKIGMRITLRDRNMPEREIADLTRASMVLPDYKANPRLATAEEMLELIRASYT